MTHKTLLLAHLEQLGLRVNWTKSILSPSQEISFLGIDLDSRSMIARLTRECAAAIQPFAATFTAGKNLPLRMFQRMMGLMASASTVLRLGLLHWVCYNVPRAECPGLVPAKVWKTGLLRLTINLTCVAALKPWTYTGWYQAGVNLGAASQIKVISTDASSTGWGALYEGRPSMGLWSDGEKRLHINCLEMKAVENALQFFLPVLKNHHVLVRTDKGGLRSRSLLAIARRLLIWGQYNLRSLRACAGRPECGPRYAIQGQALSRGVGSASHDGAKYLGHFWQSGGRPVCVTDQRSLPNVLFKRKGAGPKRAQAPSLCVSPCRLVTTGNQVNQGNQMLDTPDSPAMGE